MYIILASEISYSVTNILYFMSSLGMQKSMISTWDVYLSSQFASYIWYRVKQLLPMETRNEVHSQYLFDNSVSILLPQK